MTSAGFKSTDTGFVGVSDQEFVLDGNRFTVIGYVWKGTVIWEYQHSFADRSNTYWVGLGGYGPEDVDQAFSDIKNSGATVARTWCVGVSPLGRSLSDGDVSDLPRGFNEVTPRLVSTISRGWMASRP